MSAIERALRGLRRALGEAHRQHQSATREAPPGYVFERETHAETEGIGQASEEPPAPRPERTPDRAVPRAADRRTRSAARPLAERVRARLRQPESLREAFLLKEVLDRPVARRRRGSPPA